MKKNVDNASVNDGFMAESCVEGVMGRLLGCLDVEDRQLLLSSLEIHRARKHEEIYVEGDVAQFMYCVIEGNLGVIHGIGSSQERMLTVLRRGDFFGYRDYLANHNRSAKVVSVNEAVLYRIPNSVMLSVMEHNQKLTMMLLSDLAVCTRAAELRYLNMSKKHLRGRLADTLLYLLERIGDSNDGQPRLTGLKREDLAQMSDMTVANAIRTLSSFVKEGIVTVDGRTVCFHDIHQLERISMVE